jgi:hypothetical protein
MLIKDREKKINLRSQPLEQELEVLADSETGYCASRGKQAELLGGWQYHKPGRSL